MKKSLRSISLTLAFLALSSGLIHSAHLDESHLSQKSSHDCVLCQTVHAANTPVSLAIAPIFDASISISSLGVLLLQNELFASSRPRGPPQA